MTLDRATIDVRVSSKWNEATDIMGLELVDAKGGTLPSFAAGSHVDVHLPNGLVRQYSLCNDPGETHRYVIGVLRNADSAGGSSAVHDLVNEGDVLKISAPKNHFALEGDATRSLLFAGGIGITPILCMAERLAHFGSPFEMHYCTRSEQRTAFLSRIRKSDFAPCVHFHFDEGGSDGRLDIEAVLGEPQLGAHVYVCGPRGFMDAVLGLARERGWGESQLHSEVFQADAIDTSGDGFEVRIASTGNVIKIPAGVKVTEVLEEQGILIPTSCRQGVCGTCLTHVLEGEPDHRDAYLTPEEREENKMFLPCCSRAKSPLLVLDL